MLEGINHSKYEMVSGTKKPLSRGLIGILMILL